MTIQRKCCVLIFCCILTAILLISTLLSAVATAEASVQNIIIPFSGPIEVTVNNAITNQCNGSFGIYSPNEEVVFSGYNNLRGESKIIGSFSKDTELIFFMSPASFCSGYKYLSTDITHAKVYNIATGIWRIEWEDLPDNWPPDNDFDDLIITVRLIGAYPDYKQNRGDWASIIYANNQSAEDNIAKYGCAMTTLANLLAYYGARDTDPGVLNTWMKQNEGYDNNNGVKWASIKHYRPQGSDVAVIDWVKNISRGDPRFYRDIEDSLNKNWPVVLRLDAPESPSGIHFVVAIGIESQSGGQAKYIVKDPLINNQTGSEYFAALNIEDRRIVSAILYKPADGVARPAIVVTGHSPIEMMLTDTQGRRLGYDYASGIYYFEIPTGYYAHEGPYWTPNNSTDATNIGERLVLEVGSSSGNYGLLVYGTGEGPYEIDSTFFDGQSLTSNDEISGTISLGTTVAYNIRAFPGQTIIERYRTLSVLSPTTKIGINEMTPITIRLLDASNRPIANKTILLSASLGVITSSVITNQNGEATATYSTSEITGISNIIAETDGLRGILRINVSGPIYLPLITR